MDDVVRSAVRCVALDFDHTLAYFSGGYGGLEEIFVRRGIPSEIAQEVLAQTTQQGFTIENYRRAIEAQTSRSFADEAVVIREEFAQWLSGSLCLYPDSVPFAQYWRSCDVPVVVVTFGVPEYQREKIQSTALPCSEIRHTTVKGRKADVLAQLCEQHGIPVVFVDDDPKELDAVRDNGITEKQVLTVLIVRPDQARAETPRHLHHRIQNLAEVNALLRSVQKGENHE